MKIIVAENYEELSAKAAVDLLQLMGSQDDPVICTASGDSPAGLYKEIVQQVMKNNARIDHWKFLSLDEWTGLNGSDEGSCRYHLDQQLFHPLKVDGDRICFFDGKADDLEKECKRIEAFINHEGGIDVSVLGLGMNGHIGMNEPYTSKTSRTHVADLDPITQQTGQKYFKKEQALTGGITLGIATLLDSRHIQLLVSGAHKAPITKQILEAEVSEKLPGSLLRNHPGLTVYLDKSAAILVEHLIP